MHFNPSTGVGKHGNVYLTPQTQTLVTVDIMVTLKIESCDKMISKVWSINKHGKTAFRKGLRDYILRP